MKISTIAAVLLGLCVAAIALAHVATRQMPGDGMTHVLLALIAFAALLWDSNLFDGWIKAIIAAVKDWLPFRRNTGA